jgi:hypothetical protein
VHRRSSPRELAALARLAHDQFARSDLSLHGRAVCAYRLLWRIRLRIAHLNRAHTQLFLELWDSFGLPAPGRRASRADAHMIEGLDGASLSRIERLIGEFANELEIGPLRAPAD